LEQPSLVVLPARPGQPVRKVFQLLDPQGELDLLEQLVLQVRQAHLLLAQLVLKDLAHRQRALLKRWQSLQQAHNQSPLKLEIFT
jgi:hypothetical protein